MSSLYGIINVDGKSVEKKEADDLRKTLNKVKFDREGCLQEENLCMGILYRGLRKDREEEIPKIDEEGGRAIVADVRLDNREELGRELDISPENLPDYSDSSIILEAYKKWGEMMPEHLLGDFAFVLYDKNKETVFCARDHFGVRPLYYHFSEGAFLFSSLLDSVLTACPKELTPNDTFITRSFIFHPYDLSETLANEVFRLPPGHALTISKKVLSKRRYWEPEKVKPLHLKSEEEYAAALRNIYEKAVKRRIQTDYPIGTHLSYGLDCASVTILAAREAKKNNNEVVSFSLNFHEEAQEESRFEDREAIRRICKQEGIRYDFTSPTKEAIFKALEKSSLSWEGVFQYRELLNLDTVRKNQCRVLLTGIGGDEISSYNFPGVLAELLLKGKIVTFFKEALKVPGTRYHLSIDLKAFLPDFLYSPLATSNFTKNSEKLIHQRWRKSLIKETRCKDRIWPSTKRGMLSKMNHGFMQCRVETLAEWGEEYGVDFCHPSLDKEVIEFMLSVPPEMLFRNGWKRYLFRKAMEGILPPENQWKRDKQEPGLIASNKMIKKILLSETGFFINKVKSAGLYKRYFDAKEVDRIISEFEKQAPNIQMIKRLFPYAVIFEKYFGAKK